VPTLLKLTTILIIPLKILLGFVDGIELSQYCYLLEAKMMLMSS